MLIPVYIPFFFVLERVVNQNLIIKVPYYFEIIINQENWQ